MKSIIEMTPQEFIEYLYDTPDSETRQKIKDGFDWFKKNSGKSMADHILKRMKDGVFNEQPTKTNIIDGLEEALFNIDFSRLNGSLAFSIINHVWNMGSGFPKYLTFLNMANEYFTKNYDAEYTEDMIGGMAKYKG